MSLFSFKNDADKVAFANDVANNADYSGFSNTLEMIFNI